MDPTPKLSRDLILRMSPVLIGSGNRHGAEEMTELLNRELDPNGRPFRSKQVAERLQGSENTTLRLLAKESSPHITSFVAPKVGQNGHRSSARSRSKKRVLIALQGLPIGA